MDNKVNTILSSAIANHGNRLLTSNAFCKVYLTGYLADHHHEKDLLIDLKQQELPKAFLDFKESQITEDSLLNFINGIRENSKYETNVIAWGVNAWAAAVDLSKPVRLNILRQCFDHSEPVLNFVIPTKKAVTSDINPNATPSWTSACFKTAAAASLAALIWMFPSQESDNYTSLKVSKIQVLEAQELEEVATNTFELASEPKTKFVPRPAVVITRIGAAEMIDQTLADLKQPKGKQAPKPMVIGKSRSRTLKKKQLRAAIDAYLLNGQ